MKQLMVVTIVLFGVFCLARFGFTQPGDDRRGPDGPRRPGRFGPPLPLMRVLDADADGELSAEEIANASTAIKKLDRDKNGKLTEEELRPEFDSGPGGFGPPGGSSGFPGGAGRRDMPNPEAVVARWMTLDKNNDGKLGEGELSERLSSLLTRADADKDGFVTKEELTTLATKEFANSDEGPRGLRPGSPGRPGPR